MSNIFSVSKYQQRQFNLTLICICGPKYPLTVCTGEFKGICFVEFAKFLKHIIILLDSLAVK